MSKLPPSPSLTKSHYTLLTRLPSELHVSILTYLRASELSQIQQACTVFNDTSLIQTIIETFAQTIYPSDLTHGYNVGVLNTESYEVLQNMEWLIVARVLSRPAPTLRSTAKNDGYYVSKAWCRTALRWLDSQTQQRQQRLLKQQQQSTSAAADNASNNKKKNKKNKKQERMMRNRYKKNNGLLQPPSPNVNSDLVCEHGYLKSCATTNNNNTCRAVTTSITSNSKQRRLMDKQAWRILKKLYPHGIPLSSVQGECVICRMENETHKRTEELRKLKETEERKQCLSNVHVRQFYTRGNTNRGGVPLHCVGSNSSSKASSSRCCPLIPGVYAILPRSWCHFWRKYVKTGGKPPKAPDTTSLLFCAAHKLPLIPPHLQDYLYGITSSLLLHDCTATTTAAAASTSSNIATLSTTLQQELRITPPRPPVGLGPITIHPTQRTQQQQQEMISTLRASGLSLMEIENQRMAMEQMEQQQQRTTATTTSSSSPILLSLEERRVQEINEQLDRENEVVVEIVTEEELDALEKWFPEMQFSYALKFVILDSNNDYDDILWSTTPCRECAGCFASGKQQCTIRNRCRSWANK